MGVRADLEVAAVLALVHVGVHVAHDGVLDLADGAGEERHRADADHLVDRRGERDGGAGHPGDAGAPHAAADDDGFGLDGALVGADGVDAAIAHVEAGDLGAGEDRERAHGLGALAHDGAGAERIDDADAGGVEAAQDDRFIEIRHESP